MTGEQVEVLRRQTIDMLEAADRPLYEAATEDRAAAGIRLGRYFDHTLLKPEAQAEAYETLCSEAINAEAFSVCVPPDRVFLAHSLLAGSSVAVCTVIGFPLGYHAASAQAEEVAIARDHGATEFDMVIPIGRLKDGDVTYLYDVVRAVCLAAGKGRVKVILETALLTEQEKVRGAVAALAAGAGMLKTSTGFASAGATVEDIRLLRLIAGESRGVKAAGGIRNYAFARELIDAGADRLGASATMAILAESRGETPAAGGSGY